MPSMHTSVISVALFSILAGAGCSTIHTHVDCDQVAQQQRSGVSDTEIAQQMGHSVNDVQACAQTKPGNETAASYSEPPRVPFIPNLNSGSFAGGMGGGGIGAGVR